ncbi:hypothetical protein [Actinoplanes sp. NPDC049265]|uniref:hypothetical protein n=1 Tax=Actinoplanes sp. NPDC049265 TaxID=3363902 RepID=UPI00371DCCF0
MRIGPGSGSPLDATISRQNSGNPPGATISRLSTGNPPGATISRPGRGNPRSATALRIAVWQIGVVLGCVAILRGSAGAGALAALTLIVSAARIRGDWLSTVAGRWLGFVTRRRVFAGEHLPLPANTRLTSAGVLVGAGGLTVVARTREVDFPRFEGESGGPRIDLQWVGHLGPRQDRPSAWLAITVVRDADFAGDEQLRVALDNVLRRVRPDLLSGRELTAVLGGIAHAGPACETWRHWRSGPVTQITFRGTGPAARFLKPGGDVAVTVARWPDGDSVIRVAARDAGTAERAAREVSRSAVRLDGRHGPAVLASLPIGGKL